MSPFLRWLENEVQIVALSFMGLVYTLRLIWILRFRSRGERTFPAGSAAAGVFHSLLNIALPWTMESTRRHPFFYLQFIFFHLGVATAIGLSFVIPYWPELLLRPGAVLFFRILLVGALLVGLIRLWRRITKPAVRLISTIDDFLSLVLVDLFFVAALAAAPNRFQQSEWPLIAFFILTALLLIYVPFSKIGHYFYYPFSRFFFGRQLGHRGVVAKRSRPDPPSSGHIPDPEAPGER